MSNIRPHPCANLPIEIEGFEFIKQPVLWCSGPFSYSGVVIDNICQEIFSGSSLPAEQKHLSDEDHVFKVKKNKFGNYEHEETSFVFNRQYERVDGKQMRDGSVLKLTEEDIQLCKEIGFRYLNDGSEAQHKEEIVNNDRPKGKKLVKRPKPTVLVPTGEIKEVKVPEVIPTEVIEELLTLSRRSLVGKGSTTELDEEVRSSSDILAKDISLNENFVSAVDELIPGLAETLLHPYKVKAQFYKMVIYKEGDHFHTHMDAPHKKNMIMTLSIELPTCEGRIGGQLVDSDHSKGFTDSEEDEYDSEEYNDEVSKCQYIIMKGPNKGKQCDWVVSDESKTGFYCKKHIDIEDLGGRIIPDIKQEEPRDGKCSTYAMFYHDVPHRVTKVRKGYKVSLIFDIIETDIVNDPIINKFREPFTKGLNTLIRENVTKIGFLTNHIYMDSEDVKDLEVDSVLACKLKDKLVGGVTDITLDYLSGIKLKGIDRITSILMREAEIGIKLVDILSDGHKIYHNKLVPIMNLDEAFGSLYTKQEDNRDNDEGNNRIKSMPRMPADQNTRRKKGYCRFDSDNTFCAIKDEYLLGDTVFIESDGKLKLYYSGSGEDISLGNEGFYGEIHGNLAVIGTLTRK